MMKHYSIYMIINKECYMHLMTRIWIYLHGDTCYWERENQLVLLPFATIRVKYILAMIWWCNLAQSLLHSEPLIQYDDKQFRKIISNCDNSWEYCSATWHFEACVIFLWLLMVLYKSGLWQQINAGANKIEFQSYRAYCVEIWPIGTILAIKTSIGVGCFLRNYTKSSTDVMPE